MEESRVSGTTALLRQRSREVVADLEELRLVQLPGAIRMPHGEQPNAAFENVDGLVVEPSALQDRGPT